MKKFLILTIIFLMSQNLILANPANLSFIYINGSNNNDQKMKNWYEKGVKKLHPVLKNKFETNKGTRAWFNPENGVYLINEQPIIFFWGDKSKNELEWVQRQLDFSKTMSTLGAFLVKRALTSYLHDALWVQKPHNMTPMTDNLNKLVQSEYKDGRRTVLYGYSAGTFITYEYLLKKLPYVSLTNSLNITKLDKDTQKFINANPQKDTCLSALEISKVGFVSDTGRLMFDKSQHFRENYLNLNSVTDKVCSPEGALLGVVNFASPLPLFYSDLVDTDYEIAYYNQLMLKYIIEHGIFFLTINFREDPLGFPTTKNATVQELETFTKFQFVNPNGFIYDNSGVWSRHTVIYAHTAYWRSRKPFSDAVVKTYIKGYKYNYDENYQKQQLMKRVEDFIVW